MSEWMVEVMAWLSQPRALIFEVSPLLVLWSMAISFFLTVACVAVVSRGRRVFELLGMFLVVYLLVTGAILAGASWIFDIEAVTLEVVEAPQPYRSDEIEGIE